MLCEGVLVLTVCFSYLALHAIAVYGIVEALLGYADEHGDAFLHLCLYGEEYGAYRICSHRTVGALEEAVHEDTATEAFALLEGISLC